MHIQGFRANPRPSSPWMRIGKHSPRFKSRWKTGWSPSVSRYRIQKDWKTLCQRCALVNLLPASKNSGRSCSRCRNHSLTGKCGHQAFTTLSGRTRRMGILTTSISSGSWQPLVLSNSVWIARHAFCLERLMRDSFSKRSNHPKCYGWQKAPNHWSSRVILAAKTFQDSFLPEWWNHGSNFATSIRTLYLIDSEISNVLWMSYVYRMGPWYT
jgi:hypothetical protein